MNYKRYGMVVFALLSSQAACSHSDPKCGEGTVLKDGQCVAAAPSASTAPPSATPTEAKAMEPASSSAPAECVEFARLGKNCVDRLSDEIPGPRMDMLTTLAGIRLERFDQDMAAQGSVSAREAYVASSKKFCAEAMAKFKPVCDGTAKWVPAPAVESSPPAESSPPPATAKLNTDPKGKCNDGWSAGEKGICYRIAHVKPDYGTTDVMGEVIAPKKYRGFALTAALYKGDQLIANCPAVLTDVEKDTATPFNATCDSEQSDPTKVVIRIANGF